MTNIPNRPDKIALLGMGLSTSKKCIKEENYLYDNLLLGVRYFEIFPFVYKSDRKQIFVKIGKSRIQSLDNFISNLTSFSHQYNESAIISVNFDLYNGSFSEKLLNIEEQKHF